jgi:hypothetical protein
LTLSSPSWPTPHPAGGTVSNDPQIGGFPAWYQDTTGLTLEFCDPLNQSELDGGWCLLLPADVPKLPEKFPNPFSVEHFYYSADADANPPLGGKALLRMSMEASFPVAPLAGAQMTFARIRIRIGVIPMTGTYRIIHPYGEEHIDAIAGAQKGIDFTEDIGIACAPGDFTCAMTSRLGPFLLPSVVPGGAEMPAVTATNPTPDRDPAHFGGLLVPTPYPGTGKSYIADPARTGPVTGSPLPPFTDSTGALRDHNIFRIEGPAGCGIGGPGIDFLESTDFSLQGRVYTGTIPGNVILDRASYTNGSTGSKLDVFASGSETVLSRLPGAPQPAPVLPQLSFFPAACTANPTTGVLSAPTGATEGAMLGDGKHYWAQVHPSAIPTSVCVKDSAARDANANVVPAYYQASVTDEVTVTSASYDAAKRTLTVNATSSDAINPPTLKLGGGDFTNSLTAGQVVVSSVLSPPATVRVDSSRNGSADLLVTVTGAAAPPPPPPPALLAGADTFTILEDAGLQAFNVLSNDTGAAGGIVTIVAAPRLGSASVNPDGTIAYRANLNANGIDDFTYRVAVGTKISNVANVTVNITPQNDLPTAVNDTATANVNVATALPSLTANDTDPDGNADIVAAVNLSAPVGPGAATVTGGAGGLVTFTADTAGKYTFTYQAQDSAGALSNVATVTVNVITADIVVVSKATYDVVQKRWVVTGTSSVGNQTISLSYVDGALPGFEFATDIQVAAGGTWKIDARDVSGNEDPTTLTPQPTRIRATSDLTGSGTIAIKFQ